MKRCFFACFICFVPFIPQAFPQTDLVNIPDPVLRAEIFRALTTQYGRPMIPNQNEITKEDMTFLRGVTLAGSDPNARVSELTGLECATSITQVYLGGGTVDGGNIDSEDLSPLAGLTTLQSLILDFNPITDLSHLSALTNLRTLRIQRDSKSTRPRITDLSPLVGLVNLNELNLNSQQVDILTLPHLPVLKSLNLRRNGLSDITPVGGLTELTRLYLQGNTALSEISALSSLTQLEILELHGTSITEAGLRQVLPNFPRLTKLYMSSTPIADLQVLQTLPATVVLDTLHLRFVHDHPRIPPGQITVVEFLEFQKLKDIGPLVVLMRDGRIGSGAFVEMRFNFNLNYESLYTHIPELLAATLDVRYTPVTPALEPDSPAAHVGGPGTAHTFIVRATATNAYLPYGNPVNRNFEGVPVTFMVTAPDGTTQTSAPVLTDAEGLARFTITLGNNNGDTHTVEAFVPEKRPAQGPTHPRLSVMFTATVDDTLPPIIDPPDPSDPPRVPPLTVTFADYPEDRPTETFQLTIRFSEPVTGFRPDDITIETELKTGNRGNPPALETLTPTSRLPVQTYTAEIGLPPRTTGTLKLIVRARAANSATRPEVRGPATATASDPIDFGRRRVYIYPSHVPMDTIIFNEFRNAPDDRNDWVELKNIGDEPVPLKEWEISLVLPHAVSAAASHVERAANDRDVVEFPEYTLPPGGVLLIVNTDPSENDLIHGQNIENPDHNPILRPHYLIAPELILPDTPYLLILRSARDKNGAWDGFEDLLGNYHRGDVSYRTQIWPLRDTWVYTGTGAQLSDAEVYARVMIERVTSLSLRSRLVPEKRGYLRGAWVPSEVRSGLGYRPGVSLDTALGTPGYATPTHQSPSEIGTGDISISEVMFATNDRGTPAQWIELYNNSTTEIINLEDYRLRIELRDHQPVHRHITFPLKSLKIMPRQTVLLVSRKDRASENIPERQIYDVERQLRRSPLLRAEGFSVRLLSPDEMLVDRVGNLDGKVGRDEPRWALPSGFTETGKRSSLIRRYEDGVPWQGTVPSGWVRASATSLLGPLTYYGLSTDDGTPGYRQGSPLPVTLSSFRADRQEGGVVVTWTTASEMENAGFHVLRRRDQASDFVQINPTLILGAGTTAEAQTYAYRDTTAQANVLYYYRLEEVSLSGERRVSIATVRMRGHLSAVGKSLYKWADVKKSQD